jgi:hypothetical protein
MKWDESDSFSVAGEIYAGVFLASSDKGKRQRGNRLKDQETRNSKDFL